MSLAAWSPRVLSVLRFVSGLIFLLHGAQKLIGWPPRVNPAPELLSLFGLGGILELVGGTLIMIGLFTRPVAFLLAGEMAFAYFMFHQPRNLYPTINGGDAAILFCFIFLYLVFAGPGPWSLDAKRK